MDSKQGIHVMTLANSIIGVSILAMPYCFKQCGIVLSIILLVISSIISRLTCHFLLKSAIKVRLRTFEYLAYHVFGSVGKLFVEIAMIGFLIGTCIAFFVVMGDLGPQIIAHMTETKSTDTMRTTILIVLAVFCVLPLGLLRNVDSLSGVCTATIGFYGCLVLKIMGESAPHLLVGDWYNNVEYWRPAGILQCIPIFSMALFCQTQLFEIYQAIPNASLDKMNNLVRIAVNICTCVYIFVGIFGYIAISEEANFSGNILSSFKPSTMTEIMKIGFVLSVAFSFPLVIFPCRASLYSLLNKPTYSSIHETSTVYIPEAKFRILTFIIVAISLIIGVLIPNIELVLGLVGSTIGVMICVLFPATCFICLTSKNTNERILAQIMLFIGIVVMVLGTYANLYAMEKITHVAATEKSVYSNDMPVNANNLNEANRNLITTIKSISAKVDNKILEAKITPKNTRREPPLPYAPLEETQPKIAITEKVAKEKPQPEVEIQQKPESIENKNELPKESDSVQQEQPLPEKVIAIQPTQKPEISVDKAEDKKETKQKPVEISAVDLNIDAIQKEENELKENAKQDAINLKEQKQLLQHQTMLLNEQKKVLQEIKLRQEQDNKEMKKVQETKLKAVKQIADFAKSVIEKIVDEDNGKKTINEILNVTNIEAKNSIAPNPKPLSYQLGLDTKKNNEIINDVPPLPIVFGNLTQNKLVENKTVVNKTEGLKIEVPKTGDLKILQIIKGMPTITKSVKVEVGKEVFTEKPKNDEALNEVENIRRDILSEADYTRRKRDIDDTHCEQENAANDVIDGAIQEKIIIAPLSRDLKSIN